MFQSHMNKKKREIWEVEVDRKKLWHNFLDTRSEDGFGFLRPGLKTGVESDIFWSEIGSGFGKPGGTPQPRIPRNIPPGGGQSPIFSSAVKKTKGGFSLRMPKNLLKDPLRLLK